LHGTLEKGKLAVMTSLGYLAAVNVVIWIGLFAYLWRLDRRLTEKEGGR
jgi:CcmD family protein